MNNCCENQKPLTLKIKQGESKGFAFTLNQNNNPVDLSNSTIVLQVRENFNDDGNYVISKTITTDSNPGTNGIINNPVNGQFYFKVNDSDIEELSTSKPYYCAIYRTDEGITTCISAPAFQSALFLVLNP